MLRFIQPNEQLYIIKLPGYAGLCTADKTTLLYLNKFRQPNEPLLIECKCSVAVALQHGKAWL